MGGSIGFESEVGKGSTFWFILPFAVREKQEVTAALSDMCVEWKTTQSNCPSCPILLVEDYVPNQEVARMHLEGAGYKVDIACDGVAALKRCDGKEYSLILMDIQMPEMDGFEATRQLRKKAGWTERVVILGLSANADEKSRKDCMAAGMNGLVTKPIRREAFLREVARRLASAGSQCACPIGVARPVRVAVPMDYQEAIQEFAGDKALLDSVTVQFVEMARKQIVDMKGYLATGDAEAIGREAHKIKGAAGNLLATPLSTAAKVAEEKGKSGDLLGMGDTIAQLEKELDCLEAFVKNGYSS
jgi:CheY-like chemotaxis protein/HPt (histidine-containing phosphotransfer) domain-containing protein